MSQTPLSGKTNIDALLSTYQWGIQNGKSSNVTYSIPTDIAWWVNNYSADNEPNTWSGLDVIQQQYFKQALAAWADVANISFTQVADNQNSTGSIRVAFSDAVASLGVAGWAYNPGDLATNGDIWLSKDLTDFSPGSRGYETLLHELGHALGLKHPFENAFGNATVLLSVEENTQFTLMSYNEYQGAGFQYNSTDGINYIVTVTQPSSPMLYDIAAMQFLYGANMTTHKGNDVYTFSNSEAELRAIWDAGGIDTFDLSNQTLDMVINLNPGTFSSLGVKQTSLQGALTTATDNIAIAYQVAIEKAMGGAGNDTLYGNKVANLLDGGVGNDTLLGGAGNDKYLVDSLNDVVKEKAAEGIDTILSPISYSLATVANVENLTLTGKVAINAAGNGLKNTLTGNAAVNMLTGGAGNDILNGMSGNDKLIGGAGKDVFQLTTAFNAKNNVDKIVDFVPNDDTIQLENSVFTAFNKTGVLTAAAYDYLLYSSEEGKLYYDSDGTGTNPAVQIALLGTGLTLTYADFVVI